MILPIIMALAQAVGPRVVGLLAGETAGKAADMISQTARALTGESTDEAALKALEDKPELMIKYRADMNEHAVEMYAAETERQKVTSDAIHLEHANKYSFVRNMRPLFGYTVIYMLFMTFNTILYTMLKHGPDDAVKVIKAFSEMEWIYIAALTAIGVYVSKRSKDKNPGAIGMIGRIIGKMRK